MAEKTEKNSNVMLVVFGIIAIVLLIFLFNVGKPTETKVGQQVAVLAKECTAVSPAIYWADGKVCSWTQGESGGTLNCVCTGKPGDVQILVFDRPNCVACEDRIKCPDHDKEETCKKACGGCSHEVGSKNGVGDCSEDIYSIISTPSPYYSRHICETYTCTCKRIAPYRDSDAEQVDSYYDSGISSSGTETTTGTYSSVYYG